MASPKPRILVVDDDNFLLKVFRNSLNENEFEFDAAISGERALEKVKDQETPYEVIVSDMLMPGINGVQLLNTMREQYPDTVRILLTGCSDITCISEAINQVDVFRFIPKPLNPNKVNIVIRDAVKQQRLVVAEHEILQNTLVKSVDALVKILEVTNGTAFALTEHVRTYSVTLGTQLKAPKMWGLEIAALLSQIGCITIPELVLERYYWGDELTPKENAMLSNHGEVGKSIIGNIPRLEEVADVVAAANRLIDLKGFEERHLISMHAAIIKVAIEFDMLARRGKGKEEILEILSDEKRGLPPALLEALEHVEIVAPQTVTVELEIDQIKNGMYIEENVKTKEGVLIVSKGHRVNEAVRNRLINFFDEGEIDRIIKVKVSRY